MPRLFVALDPSDVLIRALSTLQTDLFEAHWVDPSDIHLTLRFLGDVDEQRVKPIIEALQQVKGEPFELQPEGFGVFPTRRSPKVLWVGLRDEPALDELHRNVEQAIVNLGFEPEDRAFAPHLTIARCKRADPKKVRAFIQRQKDFSAPSFTADTFYLYKSDLHPSGARYTKLRSFEFERNTSNPKD